MSFSMDWKTNNFDRCIKDARAMLPAAVFMESQEIMADSQKNYVPVDTGHLRTTGHADMPVNNNDGTYTVVIGYDAVYATVVHEAPPERGQGKNKFLEKPLLAASKGFSSRVSRRARDMLGW